MEKEMSAVIFDMDGVIFDSERCVYRCWCDTAEKYGLKDLDPLYRMVIGTNPQRTREIFLDYYGEDAPYDTFIKEQSALYHSRHDGGRLPLKPGIRGILQRLRELDIRTAVASSTRTAVVTSQLRDAGLDQCFDIIMGGDTVHASKPDPEIFLTCAGRLGADPAETYVIEDSYNGIRAAHAGGFIPVMVPDMLEPTDEMRELAAYIFSDLTEAAEALFGDNDREVQRHD